jgi:hypothetical protein
MNARTNPEVMAMGEVEGKWLEISGEFIPVVGPFL